MTTTGLNYFFSKFTKRIDQANLQALLAWKSIQDPKHSIIINYEYHHSQQCPRQIRQELSCLPVGGLAKLAHTLKSEHCFSRVSSSKLEI